MGSRVTHSRLGIISAYLLGITAALPATAAPPGDNLTWLKTIVSDGALLSYSYGDTKLHLTELSTGTSVKVAQNVPNGWSFEFSPDGSKLAWIEDTTVKGRMRKGSSTVYTIATGVDDLAGVHWLSDTEVLYVKSAKWRRASIDGASEVSIPALTALGVGGQETDVKLTSKGIWCYVGRNTSGVEVKWKTSDGKTGGTGGTCSASFSPDVGGGISITGLEHDHKKAYLKAVIAGAPTGSVQWTYDSVGDKGFDNHRWSSNHKDLMVVQDEKNNFLTVLQVSTDKGTWMGPSGSGEMYGDFTSGSGNGAPWPGSGGICGNTTVDKDETCDPPSSCPTSCDDKNACTEDVLSGSAAECTARCGYTLISACEGGDGCCPKDCDSITDSDCSASCGNDKVETGETCDPGSSCPESCDDKVACTADLMTGSADNCNVTCTSAAITTCKNGDDCCPPGCGVTTDDDCTSAPLPDSGGSTGRDAAAESVDAGGRVDAGGSNTQKGTTLVGACGVAGWSTGPLDAWWLLTLLGLTWRARRRRR